MNAANTKTWAQKQKERERYMRQLKKGKPHKSARRTYKRIYTTILFVAFGLSLIAASVYFYGRYAEESASAISGNVITVRAGGDFQAALDRAKPGDTIVLQAGAKFVGTFTLPNKTGAEYITVQSSELAKLPKEGVRVQPKDATLMPKILSSGGGEPAIKTAANAHHYRFIGIEFAPDNKDYIYNLIALGTDKQKANEIPRFIEIDRCYLHSNPGGVTRRGIALNSADTIIKNSYLAGFAGKGEETQAIAGWNGTGNYKIVNNHLEGGAENVLFGGADPSIKDLVPSDIEIHNNYFTKPLEWRGRVTHKNTLELKNARRVTIVGNIFEHAFDGSAMWLTVRNQDNTAPWSTIEDVVIENNWIRKCGSAILILGSDDTYKSQTMKRVRIVNNLFTDISGENWGESGYFLKIADGEDITLAHNTIFNSGNIITAHRAPSRRFTLRANIFSHGEYGFTGEDANSEKNVLDRYFSDGSIVDNVIVNSRKAEKQYVYVPPRNFYADEFRAVGFINLQSGNYRLAENSKYKGKGANFDALETEIKKVQ
jgi:hypothetical protein